MAHVAGLQVYMGTLSQKCVRQWPFEDPEQSVLWGNLRQNCLKYCNIDPLKGGGRGAISGKTV